MKKRRKRNRGFRTLAVLLATLLAGLAAILLIVPRESGAVATNTTLGFGELSRHEAEYLPVFTRGQTDEKVIAITVDDCFQVDNLKTILTVAHKNGGNLTLFPIGENLQKPGMAEVIRGCVYKLGDEVENHTWSHKRIFRLSEQEMAAEIWKQRAMLNRVLGADYEQHFFRLMGGDGETDLRTHNYLIQLGYRGIAHWSISGSDAGMDQIKAALKPGAVFLFHTTDGDTEKLKEFIPYAVSRGYKLVTLNRLMGYEDNALAPYTDQAMPEPRPYREDYRDKKLGEYAWNIVKMQDALRKLGLLNMDGPSTGYYGQQTTDAIKRFQQQSGLPVTGVADGETQRRLLKG